MKGVFLITFFMSFSAVFGNIQIQLDRAYKDYKQGELSETIIQRKDNINAALVIYTELEKTYYPSAGNGKLYFNIGNTYFQLGEYPLAILYYSRAANLMPRNAEVQHNLSAAQGKLHLPTAPQVNPVFRNLFFFYYDFSLPERYQLFFVFALVFFLLLSAHIWAPKGWLKKGFLCAGIVTTIFFLSLLYSRYIEPLEGVLVKASSLYRFAGTEYAKVIDKPLPGGLQVQVMDIREHGQWLKILTPDGTLGYVPLDNIRLVTLQ